METRRFILALSLSLLVFLTYMRFFAPKPPEPPVVPPKAAPQAAAPEKPAPAAQRPEALAQKIRTAAAGRDITVETDLVKVVVNTAGGVIKQYELKKYREADTTEVGIGVLVNKILGKEGPVKQPKRELGNVQLLPSPEALPPGDRVLPLTLTPLDRPLAKLAFVEYRPSHDKIVLGSDKPAQTLVLTYSGPGGIMIEKRLTFSNSDYKVDVAVNAKGFSGYTLSLGTDFGVADKLSKDARGRVAVAALLDGNTVTEKFDKIKAETRHGGTIEWFAQEDKYFTAAVLYGGPGIMTIRKAPGPQEAGDLLTTDVTVKEKAEARTYGLYAGPKNYNLLKSYGHGLERMVDYGWFGVLAKPMFWLMTLFYGITKNYGVAIILLTIVVRILLFYPSLKSATSMEEMKAVQPQLTALREKYKKDPQRMNQEMMKLYKEHKVNPLGGCLPMLLQIPFFVALYNVLSVSIELRQAPFISFWIKDLSVYDPFYILPVLMGVSMILTMKMTATTPDPSQAKIMMFMNVAFIFLFAWLPAGLLLYITLSNALSIVQQLYVRRIIAAAK